MRRPVVLFFSLLTTLGAAYCPGHAQVLAAAVEWTVKGIVRDENGTGLPGINVVLKGFTTGTTTDP